MTSREEFEKETGLMEPSIDDMLYLTKSAEYWKAYAIWLEKRNEYYQAYINYLLGAMDKVSFMDYYESISMEPITIDKLREMLTPPDEAKRGRG